MKNFYDVLFDRKGRILKCDFVHLSPKNRKLVLESITPGLRGYSSNHSAIAIIHIGKTNCDEL